MRVRGDCPGALNRTGARYLRRGIGGPPPPDEVFFFYVFFHYSRTRPPSRQVLKILFIPFRYYETYENPEHGDSSKAVRNLKTTAKPEKPRYVIIGLRKKK